MDNNRSSGVLCFHNKREHIGTKYYNVKLTISGVTVLLSLTVFQQSVSEAMPITSLQIPLLGNLVVKLYTKNTKEIGRYNNHLIVHSRQNLFSTLYCIYRFVKKKLYIYKQPLQTSSKKVR